jgi:hypothetical protein
MNEQAELVQRLIEGRKSAWVLDDASDQSQTNEKTKDHAHDGHGTL